MKTLFSTLLLAFAVLVVSCGPKAPKTEEAVAAPEVEVVAEETKTCTCGCADAKDCTCENCPAATEEVAAEEAPVKTVE